ncbi:DNA cross-link repair protein PSO2/SNM1 [Amphichorda felina]
MVASTKTRRSNTPKKQTTLSASSFTRGTPKPTKPSRPNASILSFFKKTEKPGDSLFIGPTPDAAIPDDEDLYGDGEEGRFNEIQSPVKKRRVSLDGEVSLTAVHSQEDAKQVAPATAEPASSTKTGKSRVRGPFVMDSDSEEEENDDDDHKEEAAKPQGDGKKKLVDEDQWSSMPHKAHETPSLDFAKGLDNPLRLKHEDSSCVLVDEAGEFGEFGDLEDGDLDTFEGEEMREMRFMREQARLEAEEAEVAEGFSSEDFAQDTIDDGTVNQSCPICQGNIAGLSPDKATRHVNLCLDGSAPPLCLPKPDVNAEVGEGLATPEPASEVDSFDFSKRFSRKSIPRPAQVNPLEAGPCSTGAKSAFSKLMSNKAEDTAWATAAASEKSSRGRPAYERTCPFYKIMPGFSICVDAFRYGAIEGCKAYFLSHFHSDHYIGLTARWSHGPIYCSQVTGSLVRKQLGTATKWVIELEFEKPYDIPGTDGATVTMIPANHCPGSSLFLFQKPVGKGPNSPAKRILHCGDFRACPAHVEHPLLKPQLRESVSGKTRQQKIDICYLDTTYLNPRYSFPPQDDVISACADLCASMSPDPNCKGDVWERSAKGDGTPGVSKYFQKADASDNGVAADSGNKNPKQRLLVICGTYSIGKERICIAIAKALNSKIFASPAKIKICKQLGMPELTELLTSNPLEAQVHMQMLMEIRAETLQEYLNSYKPHFSRIVGFRPSGWNFRPSNGKAVGANTPPSTIPTQQVLHGKGWRTRFGYRDLVPQRGSTSESMCFGVPYSEHSSFRELAMFVMGLRIEKIVPTVNVGSEQSRSRMKAWTDRWVAERRRCGLVQPLVEGRDVETEEKDLWDGKPGQGGGAWW